MRDTVRAFVDHGLINRQDRQGGGLAGLTFGVKDIIDISGVPTGAGSPDWLASHPVPTQTATAIEPLLQEGAILVGKTHGDELSWSLNGENAHYGTPINVAAPGRVPGGSSSGSAAAVAAGLVNFAIGTDTGGSVRLPASHCGILGIRTTFGRVPMANTVALAPSYDTFGWFAADPDVFLRVGKAVLGAAPEIPKFSKLAVARDMFDIAGPAVTAALQPSCALSSSLFDVVQEISVAEGQHAEWRKTFQVIQSFEAWECHGDWIQRVQPNFGPGVRERFDAASKITLEEVATARSVRRRIAERLHGLVGEDAIIMLPSSPDIAPKVGTDPQALEGYRFRALELLCPAGHAGLPQVTIPGGKIDGCPVGLSFIGPPGADLALIDFAMKIESALLPTKTIARDRDEQTL